MNKYENLQNPFQPILDKMCDLERKIDKLINEKEQVKLGNPEDDLMTVGDVTDYLKISSSTLYQLTARKEIPFKKKGKRLYFKKGDLRQWIEEGSNNPSSIQEKQEMALSYLRPRRSKRR